MLCYETNSKPSSHKIPLSLCKLKIENENDREKPKIHSFEFQLSPSTSGGERPLQAPLLTTLLLRTHLARRRRAASTGTRLIQSIIGFREDVGPRNISNRTAV